MRLFLWATLLAALAACTSAHASALTAADQVRARQCGPKLAKPALPRFAREKRLDRVAERLARGDDLDRALASANFRARRTASIRLSGYETDAALANVLAARHCDRLVDPAFTAIGYAKRGKESWLVLAEPFEAPPAREASATRAEALAAVNAARSRPRRCGRTQFAAAPALSENSLLDEASLRYARELARRGALSHTGEDGSTVAQRTRAVGYDHRLVGENLAFGPATAREAVEGWLASPGHCENLMNPAFVHVGLAYAMDEKGPGGVYWVQVLAR